ncbi:hypothetical protein [Streptomyces inhibens]|uniref:hypothetical protein n=1 Tax=Streptomyces inhibens TaxID=2293571 RepID=UPI001EE6CED0|nr:hypothetical protein [Streptomyces inhibens]UKY54722.1 hypothetical protein KI385_41985 [Streptomyces inhibens]
MAAVAVRPGHPQLLAQLPDHRWIVGLPGNPYAALTGAHTLLTLLLAGFTVRPLSALPRIPLAGDVRTALGRTPLVLVTWAMSPRVPSVVTGPHSCTARPSPMRSPPYRPRDSRANRCR